jgi:hypothetical protein
MQSLLAFPPGHTHPLGQTLLVTAGSPWPHFMAQNATIRPLKRPIQANTQSRDTCTFT